MGLMHRPRFLTSLRNRIYFLLLTVLVPVLLIQATYCYNRYKARRTNELQANLEVARATGKTFDEFVAAILHQELAIGVNLTLPDNMPVNEVNRVLTANQVEHHAIRDISWVSPRGLVVASSTERNIGENISDRAYFREICAGREWMLSDLLLSRGTGQPIFSVSRGIRDKNGALLGIVVTAVVPDRLGGALAVELSKEGSITLIDREGKAVYQHPSSEWSWEERNLVSKRPAILDALAGREVMGTFTCFTTGAERIAALSPARMTGWVIISGRLEEAVMAPIKAEMVLQAGMSFMVTIAVFLVAMGVSRTITAPIESLHEHALALGNGNLEHRTEVRGSYELRELACAFNGTAEKIGEREEALRLDEARFEALYALSQMMEESREEIEDFALEQEVKITGSRIGFISFLNEDETACGPFIWSKGARRQCSLGEREAHGALELAGVWADALRKREPVIINDYHGDASLGHGFPEGHPPLKRAMIVPVFEGHRIVAVAGVGNKENDYGYSDVRQLTLLMDGMWKHIQRRKSEKALRESESLVAIGRAMSAVAHDMKTPLVSIGGFTRLVQRHLDDESPDHGRLEIAIEETRRLENMVRDMLDFSRPLKLERLEGDVEQLIAECFVVVESMAQQKRVTLQNHAEQDSVPVSFDAMRMKQVLINLLTNAIQASPEGERVTVRCHSNGGGHFVIDVTDNGCGIACGDRKEIFSPFFTTKKEGTGLGLPIVKKIVEAHQGQIEILDNEECGVTFRVQLPLASN